MKIRRIPTFRRAFSALFGAYVAVISGFVYGDEVQLAQSVAHFQAVSNEIVALLQTTLIAPKSDAADALISAAYERRNEAEAEVNEAMQTLDPTNQADGQLIEQAFAKIQSANQVVADAQMRSSEQGPLVSPERR